MNRLPFGFRSFTLGVALAAMGGGFGCSSGPDSDGRTTGLAGHGGTTGAAGSTGAAGMTGAAGSTGAAGTTGAAGSTGVAGSTGAAGTTGAAGSTGAAGTTGGAGTTGVAGSTGAAGTTGAAGSTGVAGTGGRAGSTGTAGTTGAAGTGGRAGGPGTAGSGAGGATTSGCPASATFCSTFETTALPTGASYKVNAAPGEWTRDFAVDTAQKHAGNSSLRVKSSTESGTSGSDYKMLAVPATQGTFWTRFWLRSDIDLGGDHNAFTEASDSDDPNSAVHYEFGEDVGIDLHVDDSAIRWPVGYGRQTNGSTKPYVLPKNTWYCIEVFYDGANKAQQLYINNQLLIDAPNFPAAAQTGLKFFRFGFHSFHGPARTIWYDDVVVAPTRVGGC